MVKIVSKKGPLAEALTKAFTEPEAAFAQLAKELIELGINPDAINSEEIDKRQSGSDGKTPR